MVTAYVLDALPDPAAAVRHVARLLAAGGCWVNVGPLHWHDGTAGLLRLSLDELLALLRLHGFRVRALRRLGRVPYLGGGGARGTPADEGHDCVFWVAERRAAGLDEPGVHVDPVPESV